MNLMFTIVLREITTHLRKPSFYAVTLLTPLIGVVSLAFSSFGADLGPSTGDVLSERPSRPSGYVDQSGVIQSIPNEIHQFFIPYADENEAAAALRADTIPAYFVIAPDYLQTGRVTKVSQQVSILGGEGADTHALTTLLRANLGGDLQLAQRLDDPLNLDTELVGAQAGQPTNDDDTPFASLGAGFVAALLLAFAVIQGGSWLVQAVAEEKENRTVEVVLTSVRPWQLMTGKLLGLGVVTLVQLAIWFVLSGGALAAAVAIGVSVATGVAWSLWVWTVVFFLLGFLFYGGLIMAFGSLGATARESNQIAGFMTLPMLVPVWFFFFGVFDDRPNGIAAQVLSYLPFTAPVTMVLRLGAGAVPAWQIVISVTLLVLSVMGSIWLAARVFRASTLLTGTKPTLRALVNIARSA